MVGGEGVGDGVVVSGATYGEDMLVVVCCVVGGATYGWDVLVLISFVVGATYGWDVLVVVSCVAGGATYGLLFEDDTGATTCTSEEAEADWW